MDRLLHLQIEDLIPLVVWMVIFALWAIGKVVSPAERRRRQTGGDAERPSSEPAEQAEAQPMDELREFLESLSGKPPFMPGDRPSAPRPEPQRPRARPVAPTPRTAPRTPMPKSAPIQPIREIAAMREGGYPAIESLAEAGKGFAQPGAYTQPTQIPGTTTLLVGLNNLKLPGTYVPRAQRFGGTPGHRAAGLTDTDALRRAIVQRVVLDAPLGLGRHPPGQDLPHF